MPSLREFRSTLGVLFQGADREIARRIAAANLLALASGALAGLAPLALKQMIDSASQAKPSEDLVTSIGGWGIAYLLCLSAARLLTELRPLWIGAVEQRLYAQLRRRYFEHLLKLPLDFHRDRHTGALVHSLQQAISGYQAILYSVVNGLLPVLVEGVTVAIVLVSLGQPTLTANFAATAVVLTAAISLQMAPLRASACAVTDASLRAHALLADSLSNYEPIKYFGAEQRVLNQFHELSQGLETTWRRLLRGRLRMGFTVTAVFSLSFAVSLTISIHAVSNGTLSVGGFVLANLYMLQIVRPLELLSGSARDVAQGLAFIRPMIEILEMPVGVAEAIRGTAELRGHETRRGPRFAAEDGRAATVSFHRVHLGFEGRPVLSDVNLDIPAGQSIAIVGETGSGKSSLVRLLVRLCEPDAGSIALNGHPIVGLPIAQLRSMIAVVPQDLALLDNTIAVNIGLGRENATPDEIAEAARLAGLHAFITTLPQGYATAIGEKGLKLSGGERQRIAIARAVLMDPLVFVFDEATSMLDGATESEILRNIRSVSVGHTTLTIAHRLSAIQHADEIAVLRHGKIVERGSHARLLARGGVYAAMWQEQQQSSSMTGTGIDQPNSC